MVLIAWEESVTRKTTAVTLYNLPANNDGSIATTANYIGIFVEDEVDKSQTTDYASQYASGVPAKVLLRSQITGKILNMLAGGTFATDKFLKFTTGGELIIDGDGSEKTADSVALSLEAGADATISEVLML